jgi:hypothetical protein
VDWTGLDWTAVQCCSSRVVVMVKVPVAPKRLLDPPRSDLGRDCANAPAASTLGYRARRARPFDYLLRTLLSQSTRLTFVLLRNAWGLHWGCWRRLLAPLMPGVVIHHHTLCSGGFNEVERPVRAVTVVVVGKEPRTQRARKKSDRVRNFPALAKIRVGAPPPVALEMQRTPREFQEVDLT